MFSIADIYKATANFSVENRIGLGGFGAVYRGKLKDGSLIAVKRATKVRTLYSHWPTNMSSHALLIMH